MRDPAEGGHLLQHDPALLHGAGDDALGDLLCFLFLVLFVALSLEFQSLPRGFRALLARQHRPCLPAQQRFSIKKSK